MALSDLPVELMLDIAEQLDDAGLNALARTSKQLHNLLNDTLYCRDVTKSRGSSKSLIWAVHKGVEATRTFQLAVDAGRDANPIPASINLALQDAAHRGHVPLVKVLLKVDGIDPNFAGSKLYIAPLALAARSDHSDIVELLLDAPNIDPNVENLSRSSALLYACKRGHVSIVRKLLARDDVHVNTFGGIDGGMWNPLTAALWKGDLEIVKLLLDRYDVDPNVPNRRTTTGLIEACENGNLDIVKLFLGQQRTKVNRRETSEGRTALWNAVYYGHYEITKLLLDRDDIDPNVPDNLGRTPLLIAAGRGLNHSVVNLLLAKKGIDPNAKDNRGSTPLQLARDRDSHNPATQAAIGTIISSLLSHPDTDPNPVNNNLSWLQPVAFVVQD
jgi:ankyrin repeat protein